MQEISRYISLTCGNIYSSFEGKTYIHKTIVNYRMPYLTKWFICNANKNRRIQR